jgi:hypothetical protein
MPTLKTFELFFIPQVEVCNLGQPHGFIFHLLFFLKKKLKNSLV